MHCLITWPYHFSRDKGCTTREQTTSNYRQVECIGPGVSFPLWRLGVALRGVVLPRGVSFPLCRLGVALRGVALPRGVHVPPRGVALPPDGTATG